MPGIAHTGHVVWPQVTSARDQPASEPFLLRTHGESNEVGGVHAFTGGMATHTPPPACTTVRGTRWQAGTCTSNFLTRRASGRGQWSSKNRRRRHHAAGQILSSWNTSPEPAHTQPIVSTTAR